MRGDKKKSAALILTTVFALTSATCAWYGTDNKIERQLSRRTVLPFHWFTEDREGRVIVALKKSLRMTEGSISQKIIFFAIPLFLGNLFQQLYNTADSLIVGNFLGSNALAAVSSSGNLIFLMVGFINGIAMGAGVVIARYYGVKKETACKRQSTQQLHSDWWPVRCWQF